MYLDRGNQKLLAVCLIEKLRCSVPTRTNCLKYGFTFQCVAKTHTAPTVYTCLCSDMKRLMVHFKTKRSITKQRSSQKRACGGSGPALDFVLPLVANVGCYIQARRETRYQQGKARGEMEGTEQQRVSAPIEVTSWPSRYPRQPDMMS